MAGTRTLQVVIAGDSKGAQKAFKDTEAAASGVEGKLAHLSAGMKTWGDSAVKAGKSLALNVTLPIAALGAVAFRELADSQKVAAQTEAALRSTGGAANVTAKEVDRLATSLMKKSGVDDEAIASGENLLLTFTNIRNEVGRGNAIFDRATKAALDLSIAFGTDMHSASIMLGKALNDPIAGLTSLGRAGVQFTAAQKDTIRAMVESGDVLGAQKMILKELETQVGGSAKAYGDTLPGQIAKSKEALLNSSATMLAVAAPAIGHMADGVQALAGFLMNLPAPAKEAVAAFAAFAAAAGPVILIAGKVAQAGSLLMRGLSAAAGATESLALGLMYAKDKLILLATDPAFLALVAVTAIFVGIAVAVNKNNTAMAEGAARGREMGQAMVDAAKASGHEITFLRHELELLEATAKERAATDSVGMGDVAEYAATHDKLTTALQSQKRATEEAEIADKARRVALREVADGTTEVTNASDEARNAIMGLQAQVLAASGGEIGYQQSLMNSEKAQADLNAAIAEHGPFSQEAAAAQLTLQQSQLSAASAALGLDDAYIALKATLHETPEAYDAEIRKLEQAKALHPEVAGAIQQQIDKLVWLKGSIEAVPEHKGTRVSADTDDAQARLDRINNTLRFITAAAIAAGWTGTGEVIVPEGAGAEGAIVSRPTLALIGEAGPEALVPLHKTSGNSALPSGGFGGGGNSYQIVINVPPSADRAEIGRELVRCIDAYEKRGGR